MLWGDSQVWNIFVGLRRIEYARREGRPRLEPRRGEPGPGRHPTLMSERTIERQICVIISASSAFHTAATRRLRGDFLA
jgi:hypothetical protein